MSKYRALTIGHDGQVESSRAFTCERDSDAIVWTMQLVDTSDIELWSGERFVMRVNATRQSGAGSREVIAGRPVLPM